MLKPTASAVERIAMASFAHPSPSPSRSRLRRSPNPSLSPSRSRLRRSPNPSLSPSRSRLRRSPNPNLSPSRSWLRRSPSPNRNRPSRRGLSPLVGKCLPAPAQQNRRLGLLPMFSQHRYDPCQDLRLTHRLFSQQLLLEPALRSPTRVSRFRHPRAGRRRPLQESPFRRLPAGVGEVRRRVPEEVLVAPCDRRSAPRGQGRAHQDGLLRP